MKRTFFLMSAFFAILFYNADVWACTGITLHAADGCHMVARTIEWGNSALKSDYVVMPRGHRWQSFTPSGHNGAVVVAKYGLVGLSVVEPDFVAEGINEKGLSAGLFYFPGYGEYQSYDSARNSETVADLQLVTWMLSQFATVDEVIEAVPSVRVVGLYPDASTVHWRIADASGKQYVLEIVDGQPHFYENKVGVLTNSPGFEWQVTNLNNYVNLYPGSAKAQLLGGVMVAPFGAGTGLLGIPGDVTPPSRFVRAAFFANTAPQPKTAFDAMTQAFHILNNFDIPIGVEHPIGEAPDIPSATQWTTATDMTNRRIYYRTAYNANIRCIDCSTIDFARVPYTYKPLDEVQRQPVEMISVR